MERYLWIAAGAVLGANARYLVAQWAAERLGAAFPFGTLIVNLTGSFVLGFLLSLTTERFAVSPAMRLFLAVGFLGSYTTFSSYTVESLGLLQNGAPASGLLNILGNNVAGLICALLGVYLARQLA